MVQNQDKTNTGRQVHTTMSHCARPVVRFCPSERLVIDKEMV